MSILDYLQYPVVVAFGAPVTVVEIIGFVTGALCVWGVARQRLWSWPVGIVNNAAFLILFLGTGLYGNAVLQLIFAGLAVYGWITWLRGRADSSATNDLPVTAASWRGVVVMAGAIVLGTAVGALVLNTGTDSTAAIPDAFILVGSLGATFWQARKTIQHWWVWIAIDIVSVPLYISRGLLLTGLLYMIFLALCVYGLIDWQRKRRSVREQVAVPA